MKTLHKRENTLSQDCDQSQSCDSLHVLNIGSNHLHYLSPKRKIDTVLILVH